MKALILKADGSFPVPLSESLYQLYTARLKVAHMLLSQLALGANWNDMARTALTHSSSCLSVVTQRDLATFERNKEREIHPKTNGQT